MSTSWRGRRTVHRTDPNHGPVMARFRALCPAVEDHSQGGHGYDAIIGTARGSVFVVEIKDGMLPPRQRELSANEKAAQARWGARYRVVLSEDDATALARL